MKILISLWPFDRISYHCIFKKNIDFGMYNKSACLKCLFCLYKKNNDYGRFTFMQFIYVNARFYKPRQKAM